MKHLFLIVASLGLIVASVSYGAEPTFIDRVNTEWKALNYNQIFQLATAEANKTPVKPEAFVVLFGYHLLIAGNHQQAVQSLNQLVAALQTARPAAVQAVQHYRDAFLQVPADGASAPSVQQLEELHKLFPDDFPVKALLIAITTGN